MNEFMPRTEPAASVVSATERVSAVVRPVTRASATSSRTDAVAAKPPPRSDAAGVSATHDSATEEFARAAAIYARVQRGIDDTLRNLDGQRRGSQAALLEAENSLMALMPQPVVVLPLPPASEDMVAFVSGVTQSIARQAALARAAQGNASAAVVDAAAA